MTDIDDSLEDSDDHIADRHNDSAENKELRLGFVVVQSSNSDDDDDSAAAALRDELYNSDTMPNEVDETSSSSEDAKPTGKTKLRFKLASKTKASGKLALSLKPIKVTRLQTVRSPCSYCAIWY